MLIRGLCLILVSCFAAVGYADDKCWSDDDRRDSSHIHFRVRVSNLTGNKISVTGRDAKKRGAFEVNARDENCFSHFREWVGSGRPEIVKQNVLLTWQGENPGFCYIETEFKKVEISQQRGVPCEKRRMIMPNSSRATVIAQSGSEKTKCSVTDFPKSFGEPQCKDDLEVRITVANRPQKTEK